MFYEFVYVILCVYWLAFWQLHAELLVVNAFEYFLVPQYYLMIYTY